MTTVSKFFRRFRASRDSDLQMSSRGPHFRVMDLARIFLNRYDPAEYYGLKLHKGVPDGYVTARQYSQLERRLNPRHVGVVRFDKWHLYCFFHAQGIPTPVVHGFIVGRRGVILDELFAGDPFQLLSAIDRYKPVALKPIAGAHGHGFDVAVDCSTSNGTLTLKRGGMISATEFLEAVSKDPDGLLLQEAVIQHASLAELSPSAVNTLRILTLLKPSGQVEFPSILLKIARAGSLVDNVGAGGIAAHVDPSTAELSLGFVWPAHDTFEVHPDSGVRIRGFKVPFLHECLSVAARAHQRLTSPRFLGWDVAVTPTGPTVLEMNSFVAAPIYQRMDACFGKGPLGAELHDQRSI